VHGHASFIRRPRIAAIAEQHTKLVQRLAEIVAIDFLDAPGRVPAEGLVAAIERALPRDGKPGRAPPLEPVPRPSRAMWVTRTGVHVPACGRSRCRPARPPLATTRFVSSEVDSDSTSMTLYIYSSIF